MGLLLAGVAGSGFQLFWMPASLTSQQFWGGTPHFLAWNPGEERVISFKFWVTAEVRFRQRTLTFLQKNSARPFGFHEAVLNKQNPIFFAALFRSPGR